MYERWVRGSEDLRWNIVLTSNKQFNTEPNRFLVRMLERLEPGKALDVGMGQGRNAIYLAQQGWDVTGFDPAVFALQAADQRASELGVKLNIVVAGEEDFNWGEEQWDLILFSSITRSKPTAFQAVSFKQFWMRMGGWKNIGEERIRSTTSNITSYGSRSTATRCYGAGWQSGCGI